MPMINPNLQWAPNSSKFRAATSKLTETTHGQHQGAPPASLQEPLMATWSQGESGRRVTAATQAPSCRAAEINEAFI